MGLAESFRLVGAGVAWRTLGSKGAGRRLLEATDAAGEQERMIAVISLVKAGDRTVDLLTQSHGEGRLQPDALRLLVDIGTERAESLLSDLADEPGEIGDAASQCLDTLRRREGYREDDL